MSEIEIHGLAGGAVGAIDIEACRAAARRLEDVGTAVPGRQGEAAHIADLLASFEAAPGSTHATLESADGWSASLELHELGEGWLVYALGGEPLDARAGGPFRLYLPQQGDACGNVKQLARITFSSGAGRDTRPPVDERVC